MSKKIGLSKTMPMSAARPLGTKRVKSVRTKVHPSQAFSPFKQHRDMMTKVDGLPQQDEKIVDISQNSNIQSLSSPITAPILEAGIMTLTLKGLTKNGKAALYTGAAAVIRLALAVFPDRQAPNSLDVPEGTFAAAKTPKRLLTKEERKMLPKPTLAEKIARREALLARDKAKLAEQHVSM